MAKDLTKHRIVDSYQRLVQLDPDDGVNLRDGTGSLIQQFGVQRGIQIAEASTAPGTPTSGRGILFASSSSCAPAQLL